MKNTTTLKIAIVIMVLAFSSIVISKPIPHPENQYYIFGDNSEAVPHLCFNWSNNETYLYPFNESLWYQNETGDIFDLANISAGGGASDGYAGDMAHPHDQDLNVTSNPFFNHLSAVALFGDGNNMTNLPFYNMFDQDLNSTDDPSFNYLTAASFFGDGGNLTNITASGDGYAGAIGHPHDQDLNMSSDVQFRNISSSYDIRLSNYWDYRNLIFKGAINFGKLGESRIYQSTDLTGRVSNLVIDASNGSNNLCFDVTPNIPPLVSYDMVIDSAGIIDTPRQSSARARLTSSQTVTWVTWTKLSLATEDYDLNSDFNTGSYRFVAPVEGLYSISYSVYMTSMPDRKYLIGAIYKNGAIAGGYSIGHSSTSIAPIDLALSGSDILKLNVNDYVELYVYHSKSLTGLFPSGTHSNYMAVCKIA